MAIDPFARLTVGEAARHLGQRPPSIRHIGRGDRNTVVLAEPVPGREYMMVNGDGNGKNR